MVDSPGTSRTHTTGYTTPKFTTHNVQLIIESLPPGLNQQRLKLLPKILCKWSKTDLREHLSRVPHAQNQKSLKRLQALDNPARTLITAFDALDQNDSFLLAIAMSCEEGQSVSCVSRIKIVEMEKKLKKERKFLEKLVRTVPMTTFRKSEGRPRNNIAYLVMQDLAAFFEWLTNRKAARQVNRDDGEDTGPFRNFAAALWPVIFEKGDDGLKAAMKNWAKGRKDYSEESPVLANISMRHPTWRIFSS